MSDALYLLDTNTASFAMRETSSTLRRRLSQATRSRLAISAITEAELRFGVAKSPRKAKHAALVDSFLRHVDVTPWDSAAAIEYVKLRLTLQEAGKSLGNMDLLIAAHAKALGAVLVTNDAALLRLSTILQVVDWTRE